MNENDSFLTRPSEKYSAQIVECRQEFLDAGNSMDNTRAEQKRGFEKIPDNVIIKYGTVNRVESFV